MAKPLTTDIKPPSDLELECIAHAVSQAKKVVVIIGAGASTAAGIPVREAIIIVLAKLTPTGLSLKGWSVRTRNPF